MNQLATHATGTAVANLEDRWAAEARAAATAEPLTGGTWMSARGGQLAIGETILPGAQACCIVLDSVRENTFYEGKYVAENPNPPVCYALARDNVEMWPHTDMQKDLKYFKPQHWENGQVASCQGCPRNEWGSAETGRGKACQNRRRLTLIPAGYYQPRPKSRDFDLFAFTDPMHFQSAEAVFLKLPVTTVVNWSKYVNSVAQTFRRPPHGVITRLWVQPHQQFQYELCFEAIDVVPDNLAEAILSRHAAAQQMPLIGYAAPDPNQQPFQPRGGTVRGLRR